MATKDTGQGGAWDVSRRDFLKTTAAAAAAAGCGIGFAFDAEKAAAYEGNTAYRITASTCPYCSASCGQRVVVEVATDKVVDIYGDFESPFNSGGLCAKGAGSYELVTNKRRIGAWTGTHPVNSVFEAKTGAWVAANDPVPAGWPGAETDFSAYSYSDGVAYFRQGNDAWKRVPLALAMQWSAKKITDARGALSSATYNSKGVAFFGSSHMNNESNYLYRKLIANFGTSNVEHQARI